MKLTVHIGSHKAGSTAIQEICTREVRLLETAGVHYPADVFPNYPKQHSELNLLLRSGSDADVAAFIDRIHGVAKAKGLNHVFLSGEDLCSGSKPAAIKRLADAARLKFDDVVIALILRNKAAYLLSHYNHFLRHSAQPVGLADFRKSIGFSPRRSFVRYCQSIHHQMFRKRGLEILTCCFCKRRLCSRESLISFRTFIKDGDSVARGFWTTVAAGGGFYGKCCTSPIRTIFSV